MASLEYFSKQNIKKQENGFNETEIRDVERQVANLLADWSKELDSKANKLDESALVNSDFKLESLIKQKIKSIENDPEKNELYSRLFLEIMEKGIEQLRFDGRATQRSRKYIEEAKSEHSVPGIEEELEKLQKRAA